MAVNSRQLTVVQGGGPDYSFESLCEIAATGRPKDSEHVRGRGVSLFQHLHIEWQMLETVPRSRTKPAQEEMVAQFNLRPGFRMFVQAVIRPYAEGDRRLYYSLFEAPPTRFYPFRESYRLNTDQTAQMIMPAVRSYTHDGKPLFPPQQIANPQTI